MADTPNVQAPLWAASEASPWLMSGKRARIFDAFCAISIIEDRDLSAPPVSCADGARYLVAAGATGLWATHSDQLAIAVGANASNGWYFAPIAVEGVELYIRDENRKIRHSGVAWVVLTDAISRFQDLTDVDLTGIADGYVLKYDQSNGVFYFAPDLNDIAEPLEISGATYDLLNTHQNRYLRFTNANDVTINVRAQATHALTLGREWHMRNAGGGFLTLTPASGVLINSPAGGTKIVEPGGTVTLKSIDANVLDLIGQTTLLIS